MKRILSVAALAAAALFATAPSQAATVVSFSPSSSHIEVGGLVSVAMVISGLGDEILSAFDINLLFDGGIVSNLSVTHDVAAQWPGSAVFGPSVFGVGNTDVVDYSLEDDETIAAAQADSFTVLTFGFTGLGNGWTTLRLGPNPDFERNFTGRRAVSLDVDVGTACISVGTGSCDGNNNPVPEPASWGLAGLALLAAGSTARRRREGRSAD